MKARPVSAAPPAAKVAAPVAKMAAMTFTSSATSAAALAAAAATAAAAAAATPAAIAARQAAEAAAAALFAAGFDGVAVKAAVAKHPGSPVAALDQLCSSLRSDYFGLPPMFWLSNDSCQRTGCVT